MSSTRTFSIALLVQALLLAACQAPSTAPRSGEQPPAGPLAAEEATPYPVDPERSDIRILVRDAGIIRSFPHPPAAPRCAAVRHG